MKEQVHAFSLCPACLAQFQALRFRSDAQIQSNLIPFESILWDDELPAGDERHFTSHRECNFSLIRLFGMRRQIWLSGSSAVPENELWREARALMPDWPGFRRMTLNQSEKESLRFCMEETGEIMESFRKDSSVFSVTDEGGGAISFVAYPKEHRGEPPK